MEILSLTEHHYPEVSRIYLEGIATGNATFQTEAPIWEDWDKNHLSLCRFIAFENGSVLGWTALSPVSSRCVYAGVAEVGVYVADDWRNKGVGKRLLSALINESEDKGIWMLQSGIFPENEGSIRLHEQCGFRIVGYREKIGNMNGVWRDTVLMERRSKIAGV